MFSWFFAFRQGAIYRPDFCKTASSKNRLRGLETREESQAIQRRAEDKAKVLTDLLLANCSIAIQDVYQEDTIPLPSSALASYSSVASSMVANTTSNSDIFAPNTATIGTGSAVTATDTAAIATATATGESGEKNSGYSFGLVKTDCRVIIMISLLSTALSLVVVCQYNSFDFGHTLSDVVPANASASCPKQPDMKINDLFKVTWARPSGSSTETRQRRKVWGVRDEGRSALFAGCCCNTLSRLTRYFEASRSLTRIILFYAESPLDDRISQYCLFYPARLSATSTPKHVRETIFRCPEQRQRNIVQPRLVQRIRRSTGHKVRYQGPRDLRKW